MAMQIREPVLLTGAGFTRNFGGFLANQMWDKIFNHEQVQKNFCRQWNGNDLDLKTACAQIGLLVAHRHRHFIVARFG